MTPLEENRERAWTATTDRPARSTAAAKPLEIAVNSFAMIIVSRVYRSFGYQLSAISFQRNPVPALADR
jgi:hypothetical protein